MGTPNSMIILYNTSFLAESEDFLKSMNSCCNAKNHTDDPQLFHLHNLERGCTIAQVISSWLPNVVARIWAQVRLFGICGVVALGQVFSEYLSFPCYSFHWLLHTHHYHHPSSAASTLGQTVADVPCKLSPNPPQETNLEISDKSFHEVHSNDIPQ
jgi:hypothetical protein